MINYLRQFNMASVLLRLTLAVFFGGLIGINREHKRRPAGFRTYMMVCLGAALTMVLGQYQYAMLSTVWVEAWQEVGLVTDVSRFGAQVINGIGFLGTGPILVTERREVTGLTTAAGLWASACVGLAVGAGFYEGMLLGFSAIFLCIKVFPHIERYALAHSRSLQLRVKLDSLEELKAFNDRVRGMGIQIYDMGIDRRKRDREKDGTGVLLTLHLPRFQAHSRVIARLAQSPEVQSVDEL